VIARMNIQMNVVPNILVPSFMRALLVHLSTRLYLFFLNKRVPQLHSYETDSTLSTSAREAKLNNVLD
jgi:hypothetical protein